MIVSIYPFCRLIHGPLTQPARFCGIHVTKLQPLPTATHISAHILDQTVSVTTEFHKATQLPSGFRADTAN